jgi:hypothetical protein
MVNKNVKVFAAAAIAAMWCQAPALADPISINDPFLTDKIIQLVALHRDYDSLAVFG